MGTLFLTKGARIYNGAQRASSINGAGKTGELHANNEFLTLPNISCKDGHNKGQKWYGPNRSRSY